MKFIELTYTNFDKFYLRSDLIERIIPTRNGGSEILLTTGRWNLCLESPDQVRTLAMREVEEDATGKPL